MLSLGHCIQEWSICSLHNPIEISFRSPYISGKIIWKFTSLSSLGWWEHPSNSNIFKPKSEAKITDLSKFREAKPRFFEDVGWSGNVLMVGETSVRSLESCNRNYIGMPKHAETISSKRKKNSPAPVCVSSHTIGNLMRSASEKIKYQLLWHRCIFMVYNFHAHKISPIYAHSPYFYFGKMRENPAQLAPATAEGISVSRRWKSSPSCRVSTRRTITSIMPKDIWLVVWNPLKNMKVNWDDELPNIWKNKKCSKPPTRYSDKEHGSDHR